MGIEVPIIILITVISIYFLSKWILTILKIGKSENRESLATELTFTISLLLYIGIIITWILLSSYYPKTVFNKHKWDENEEKRYEMSKDIINSEILIGKTKDEVIELLGNGFYETSMNCIRYELGFVPSLFNIDPDMLSICFENGRVIEVSQYRS
ncbi:MAG: hypothetical protein LBH25_13800 [Fibromonadaceae bacterium]|jgi:hypothetical protein|nr:hypothetical protein [Fibromonadaceae bacterium]